MKDLKRVATRGIAWNIVATGAKQILTFLIGVIMARLLSPHEFGLIGMAIVFVGFLNLFVDQGLGSAIIQRQDLTDSHLDSIFWLNAGVGAALTGVLYLFSGPIAGFYREPILKPLMILISVNFFIGSLGVVQSALIDKQVAFKKHAIINTVSSIGSGLVGIALALQGYGVWSLAWQSVVMTVSNVIVMWVVSPWRPKFHFSWTHIKDVLGFSANLLGFNLLNYWVRNFDNLLIGRFISSSALGLYSKAYQLMMLPVTQVSWVLSRVMFPVLSSIQNDTALIKSIYLRSVQAIALITFPLMIGLLVVSESFVLVVFGPKWIELVPILRIFCLAGLHESVNTTVGWLYQSRGRTDLQFKWGLVEAAVVVLSFIIGLRWGVIGIAWSFVISIYVILMVPTWVIAGNLVGMKFGEMMRNLFPPFACAASMGAVLFFLGRALPPDRSSGIDLLIRVPAGIVLYWVLVHVFRISSYREVAALVLSRGK